MGCRILALLVACVATLGSARAGTLTYSSATVIDPQKVTLSGSAVGGRETVYAGEIQLMGINGATGTLATFCIDVADWLTPAGQFSTGSYLTGSLADLINGLLTHVLPTIGKVEDASAALQVAIWEAEYGPSLTVSGNQDVTDLAGRYLANLKSGQWASDPAMRVAVLDGGGKTQSQAYLSPIAEPASLSVLGMGLFGAAALRRRRRSKRGSDEFAGMQPVYTRMTSVSINCRPRD